MIPTDGDAAAALNPSLPLDEVGASMSPTPADLAALYPQWYPRLARYFVSCGCHEALAHELAQESFAQALRGLPGFRGGSLLSTWLWSIARHVLLAELRRQRPLDRLTEVEAVEDLIFADSPHLSDTGDCVRRGFARFAAAHPERAQAVYLAYVVGWPHAELAELLDRSERATTVYLAESRARLQPFLKDCDEC